MNNFSPFPTEKHGSLPATREFSSVKKQVQLAIGALAVTLFVSICLESFGSPAHFVDSANNKPLFDSKMNPESSLTNAFFDSNASDLLGETATVHFYLPYDVHSAHISVSNVNGIVIKSFELNSRGQGQLSISGNELQAGTYRCSLIVDEKIVDSISWILIR